MPLPATPFHRLRRGATALLLALPALLAGQPAQSADHLIRVQEIAECRTGEIGTWGDGRDRAAVDSTLRLVYDHEGAPAWFDESLVLATLRRAAEAWSGCGVPATVSSRAPGAELPQGAVLVHWDDRLVRGNFGLAHVGLRRLWLGPAAFRTLRARNPAYPAHETLQMVVSHEMGHLFGLMDHSSRCVDVMSYYDNGRGEHCRARGGNDRGWRGDYRALLPTACDLQRCRAANAALTAAR